MTVPVASNDREAKEAVAKEVVRRFLDEASNKKITQSSTSYYRQILFCTIRVGPEAHMTVRG